jgi:hypothetical protein
MRLAQIPQRVSQLAEEYEVPERVNDASRKLTEVSGKVYDHMSVAGDAARRGAMTAYRHALEHPRSSIGGIILAAAIVGGVLWYVFGDWRRPAQRRRHATRVRAGAERRKRQRGARASA